MSPRNMVLTVLSLGLAAVAPASAYAQKGPDGGGEIVVRVCNNTNDNARIALSYQPIGNNQFYNEGWYGVPSRSCQELARTDNAYIYGYAEVENDSSHYWSGEYPLCVQYPGPYAFWSTGAQHCETQQDVRNFVAMHAEDWGVYTWTLDP